MPVTPSTPVRFDITSGLPFSKQIVVEFPTDRSWWTDISDFEILSQMRERESRNSRLLLDLAHYVSASFTDADTLNISIYMTGADTRHLKKSGYYDIIVSDVGTVDANAVPILKGTVRRNELVTAEVEDMI